MSHDVSANTDERVGVGHLVRELGTWEVFAAGVGLVVASTTLVSDFVGWFTLSSAFWMALLIAFVVNLLLGLSVAELSTTYPKAGAIYEYGMDVVPRRQPAIFVGIFLGFTFWGMFAFAGAAEIAAGSFGLQALVNQDSGLNWFVLIMTVAAIVPNLIGIREAAWVTGFLLIGMLGIRWFFGLAGFFGFSDTGSWSADNLDAGVGVFDLSNVMSMGLVLAFWSFVGIEFVAPLAEEVKDPPRNLPRGIIYGLVVIFATSLLMGFGVSGTMNSAEWQGIALGPAGCDGGCPQLGVGEAMFGGTGRGLMALASVSATLGSMIIAYAALPRIIYGIARDGRFFGPLSRVFAYVHPKYNTPWPAILLTGVFYTFFAMISSDVVDWVYSGAYVWILLYAVYHVLVVAGRYLHPDQPRPFRLQIWVPIVGFVLTIVTLYYAFKGVHGTFGPRALIVIGGALVAAAICYFLQSAEARREVRRVSV